MISPAAAAFYLRDENPETSMCIEVTGEAMTSTTTTHSANRTAGGWVLSWLSSRVVDDARAVSGMKLAESVARMQNESQAHVVDFRHELWPHVEELAAELGLTGADAVVLICQPATTEPPPRYEFPRWSHRRFIGGD